MATVTGTKFGYSFYCDLFGVVLVGRWQQIRNYVLVRLLLAPVMLWTVVTLVFLLLRATPGDPVDAIYGGRAPASVKEALRVQLGLDQPLWGQYLAYLGQLLRGDLGTSLTEPGRSVGEIIGAYLPATVELGLAGFLVAALLGVGLGANALSVKVCAQFARLRYLLRCRPGWNPCGLWLTTSTGIGAMR